MAQQQAAQQVAKLLGTVGRWGVVLGVGGSALQAALYTGARLSNSRTSEPKQVFSSSLVVSYNGRWSMLASAPIVTWPTAKIIGNVPWFNATHGISNVQADSSAHSF